MLEPTVSNGNLTGSKYMRAIRNKTYRNWQTSQEESLAVVTTGLKVDAHKTDEGKIKACGVVKC